MMKQSLSANVLVITLAAMFVAGCGASSTTNKTEPEVPSSPVQTSGGPSKVSGEKSPESSGLNGPNAPQATKIENGEGQGAKPAPEATAKPPSLDVKNQAGDLNGNIPVTDQDLNIIEDYDQENYKNIDQQNYGKKITGAVTTEDLLYTSSSTDSTLDLLRMRNQKSDAASQKQNLAAASSIINAKLDLDEDSNSAIVTLKIAEGKSEKIYNLSGGIEGNNTLPLRLAKSSSVGKTDGTARIDGTIKCLDLDGGCTNTLVRLRMGEPGSRAIVSIVFRQSVANLYFQLPKDTETNPEFKQLADLFINTVKYDSSNNKIKVVTLQSFEVVNGRSGFRTFINGENDEVLGFKGPLLAPMAGTAVNLPISILSPDKNSLDWMSQQDGKMNLANSIGEVRLLNNNGLGMIRLGIKMRRYMKNTKDAMAVTIMRQIKPVVELSEADYKF